MNDNQKLFPNDALQVMDEQADAALFAVDRMSIAANAAPDVKRLAKAVALGTLAVDRVKSRQ